MEKRDKMKKNVEVKKEKEKNRIEKRKQKIYKKICREET